MQPDSLWSQTMNPQGSDAASAWPQRSDSPPKPEVRIDFSQLCHRVHSKHKLTAWSNMHVLLCLTQFFLWKFIFSILFLFIIVSFIYYILMKSQYLVCFDLYGQQFSKLALVCQLLLPVIMEANWLEITKIKTKTDYKMNKLKAHSVIVWNLVWSERIFPNFGLWRWGSWE